MKNGVMKFSKKITTVDPPILLSKRGSQVKNTTHLGLL